MVAFDIADYNSAGHDSTDDDSTGQRWADYSADDSTDELKRAMVQLVTIRPVTGRLPLRGGGSLRGNSIRARGFDLLLFLASFFRGILFRSHEMQ